MCSSLQRCSYRCSFNTDERQVCQVWFSTMQANATMIIAQVLRFGMLKILRCFQHFQLFNMSTIDLPFSRFNSPNIYRPTLVASYGPSNPPMLLLTSIFHSRCRMPCCRRIPTSEEGSLAWNSVSGNALLLLVTLVAYGNRGLFRFLLAGGLWILECNGSRMSNASFCLLCSLEELGWMSMQDGWINGWINRPMEQWTDGSVWNVKHGDAC